MGLVSGEKLWEKRGKGGKMVRKWWENMGNTMDKWRIGWVSMSII